LSYAKLEVLSDVCDVILYNFVAYCYIVNMLIKLVLFSAQHSSLFLSSDRQTHNNISHNILINTTHSNNTHRTHPQNALTDKFSVLVVCVVACRPVFIVYDSPIGSSYSFCSRIRPRLTVSIVIVAAYLNIR